MSNLKSKTQKGLLWSAIDNFGNQGIHFFITIIIARLLTPEVYGIIAMPTFFLALAQCFIKSGFGNALIRKPELSEEDLSTAFIFNIGVGCFMYLLLFFTSPLIADFYNTPILKSMLRVTALALLFNPLCIVQQSILTRSIDFRRQAKISMSSSLLGGFGAIILAFYGFGVWALVFQQVAAYVIRTIMLWITSHWYPKTGWSNESFKYLWNYGSRLLASELLDAGYKNLSPLIIGKFYTSADLGNYTRANHFAQLPSGNITHILQRVTFPVLSTIQNDDERLLLNYQRILRVSTFVVFPIMLFLGGISAPLVRVLLTDKWVGCVLFLQILCFTQMWYPVHVINLNLLTVKGRSDLFFRLEIIKKIISLIAMICTLPFGIIYFVISGLFTSIISVFVNSYYSGKLYRLTFWVQMKDMLPSLILSFAMWVCLMIFGQIIHNDYLLISFAGLFALPSYILFARIFRFRELNELISMMPSKVQILCKIIHLI